MTPEQLLAIRERLDAATPGPWEAGTASCCPDMGWVEGPKGAVCPQFTATKVTHSLDANDAELIANAPTDLRALLDEVERLTAERDALLAEKTATLNLKPNERLVHGNFAMFVEQWCDGSNPCAVETEPHGHWRGSRGIPYFAVLTAERDAAFRRGAEAMRQAVIGLAEPRATRPVKDAVDAAWCRSAECILDELRNLPAPEDK